MNVLWHIPNGLNLIINDCHRLSSFCLNDLGTEVFEIRVIFFWTLEFLHDHMKYLAEGNPHLSTEVIYVS